MIGNYDTDIVTIESPSLRAGKANLVVPVPSGTAKISGSSGVIKRVEALSFMKVIALVAR